MWQRILILSLLSIISMTASADDYAMYVWKSGFDGTVPGCDTSKLVAWDKAADPECYTHTWETPSARQWLWDTANRPGREVGRLFIADVKNRLEDAYFAGDCSDPGVQSVKTMLRDGHCKSPGIELYALFATSDVDVSEQDHVPYVVWYNDVCAAAANERFDGVAVNNEAWNDVKCTAPAAEEGYLDDLQAIADAAGSLPTHYSIGWKWSYCDGVEVDVDWDGSTQPATHHMIDIFDSVDVQVAHVSASTVASRAQTAGYAYALGLGKPFYVLSYTNKSSLSECTVTHFPFDCVGWPWSNAHRSDAFLMDDLFDSFAAEGIPAAISGIHFFRGVYGSGVHTDWPSYWDGNVDICLVSAWQGPLEFAQPQDDDIISWPPQSNATLYEIARDDGPDFGQGCRILSQTPQTAFRDQERPQPGSIFSYLVRVVQPEAGSWGLDSEGRVRELSCF